MSPSEPAIPEVPADRFDAQPAFADDPDPGDLVYFVANVGDGDAQVLLLPAERDHTGAFLRRRVLIVDCATTHKIPALIRTLTEGDAPLLSLQPGTFPVVVGTHPHEDHIGGMAEFLGVHGNEVGEYWEPGYYHPSAAYMETMRELEEHPGIQLTQPTSGMTRFIGNVKLIVLSPAISLRNRFDSYGITINNSSISLKLEFPAARVEQRGSDRRYLRIRRFQSIILGADTQTLSWGHVMADFPELRPDDSPVAKELRMALGADPLRADVFKVPHHASKHGVNLELMELIRPRLSLISSVGGGGKYNFPHRVAMDSIREGLETTTSTGRSHKPDHVLGIHYTGGTDTDGSPLGSIAVVISPSGSKLHVWRFGDAPNADLDPANGRLFVP
jgi:competence protein ComEC